MWMVYDLGLDFSLEATPPERQNQYLFFSKLIFMVNSKITSKLWIKIKYNNQ